MTSRFSTHALPSAVLLACMTLAGCGGGGGSTDSNSSAGESIKSTSISGTVIDGYIEGANVCLDINANQSCDSGEPNATTAADGSYKIDTSSLTASQIKAAHLLTVVPTTSKDADDGGKTLAQAGKQGFSFMAPAAAYVLADSSAITGAVISPLTTLVSHDMIAGGSILSTAKNNVRARLGLAENTDLTQNFVAQKDATLIQVAQMLTVAIGEIKAAAKTGDTSERQALFAALEYLQTQVAELKKAFDAAKITNSSAKPVDLVKEAFKVEAAKPSVITLIAEAKKTTESSVVSSVVALLEQGIYSPSFSLENSTSSSYYKVQGAGGKITLDRNHKLSNGKWVIDSENGQFDWQLTSTGWKLSDFCPPGESVTYNAASDGVTTLNFCNGMVYRVTARIVEAGGKTLKALGLNSSTPFESTSMPAGSQLIWFSAVNSEDDFQLHTGYEPGKWVFDNATNKSIKQSFTSLDSFIASYTQGGAISNSAYIQQWSNLFFSFAPNGSLTLFDPATAYTSSPKIIGSATYTRRTVHGVEVLTINTQAPEQDPGERIFFAVKDGKVYGGSFTPKGAYISSQPHLNKNMMNAILAIANLPAVVD